MFNEPWSDIKDYPDSHKSSLEAELDKELSVKHLLHGLNSEVLGKREDCDELLVKNKQGYFTAHLTWSGKLENPPFPKTEFYKSLEELKIRLAEDSKFY